MLTNAEVELGPETVKFLNALKPSSRVTYKPGIQHFQEFFVKDGTIRDFLKRVIDDRRLDPLDQTFLDREVLKAFVKWMQEKEYAAKSIRTYAASIQSLAKFYGIEITTEYLGLPASIPQSRKYPWELESVSKFIGSMDNPMYRCIATVILQSGLAISDVLSLDYLSIRGDLESSIVPICLDLVRTKTSTPHLTFVGQLGTNLIRQHLEGKKLEDSTKLFMVTSRSIEEYFAKKAGEFLGHYEGSNPCRPHSLRSAFRTLLVGAGCVESYVEFWMGHNLGDIKKIYTSKTIVGWRAEYAKFEKALSFDL